MTIDTATYGDPVQVRAGTEWLDLGLKDATDGLSPRTTLISTGVRSHWAGELEVWIAENLDAFLAGPPQQSTAERLLAGLKGVSEKIPRAYLVRESIDAGMEQAWDATADFAEDAWENTGEFFGDAGHEMGKAWKSVFG